MHINASASVSLALTRQSRVTHTVCTRGVKSTPDGEYGGYAVHELYRKKEGEMDDTPPANTEWRSASKAWLMCCML